MDINALIQRMLVLTAIIAVGFIVRKTKLLNEENITGLSKITVNVFLTALVLSSAMNAELEMSSAELVTLFVASFGAHGLMLGFAILVPKILGAKREDYGTYRFMEAFGNCVFMGFPVIVVLLGQEMLIYGVVFSITFNVMCFTLGIKMISGNADKKFRFKSFLNAPLLSSLAAVTIMLLKVKLPGVVVDSAEMIGQGTVPLSMIIIGASLGGMRFKEVFGDWRVYVFSALRLVVTPILVFFILRLVISNHMILVVCTILCATPSGSNATMMAYTYNGNRQLASKGVFVTTILSVVTIPLVLSLLPI